MVTFKQIARSYVADVRAHERNKKRQTKEYARLYKEQQKQNEIENATDIINRHQAYIDVLTTIHKNCSDKIDWQKAIEDEEPSIAEKNDLNEHEAKQKLNDFKPSFFDKIFGNKKKINALQEAITNAKIQDKKDFEIAKENYTDWQNIQTIAKNILLKNTQSYADALNYFDPFSDISELGSNVQISFEKDYVEIELFVNNAEVIPDFILSLLKTGKLSRKEMPKGKFNELYQDYVCGAVLRVSREALAYLPIKMVVIHAISKMVNTATGHLEDFPIVSAIIPSETINNLNFETLDPSDSMKNFLHYMKFSKTNGFSHVEKLNINDLKIK